MKVPSLAKSSDVAPRETEKHLKKKQIAGKMSQLSASSERL